MSEFWQLFHNFVFSAQTLRTFVRISRTSLARIKFYAAARKIMANTSVMPFVTRRNHSLLQGHSVTPLWDEGIASPGEKLSSREERAARLKRNAGSNLRQLPMFVPPPVLNTGIGTNAVQNLGASPAFLIHPFGAPSPRGKGHTESVHITRITLQLARPAQRHKNGRRAPIFDFIIPDFSYFWRSRCPHASAEHPASHGRRESGSEKIHRACRRPYG